MSLQITPASERPHIAFFGVRNAGKSSLVNAVTGQDLAVVSDVRGTTTDPVKKTMELLPLGPVVIIDTPGIDDAGELGEERVRRAKRVLDQTDIAVLVVAADVGMQDADRSLIALFEDRKIPYLIAINKIDLMEGLRAVYSDVSSLKGASAAPAPSPRPLCGSASASQGPATKGSGTMPLSASVLPVSTKTGEGIYELKEAIARLVKDTGTNRSLVSDLVSPGDLVVLVIPIDKSAPKGRLILPQQMVIRDLLDAGAQPLLVRDKEYPEVIDKLGGSHPALVITDSQVFDAVSEATPANILLTSFSILMARYKGTLAQAVEGAKKIAALADGDTVLISEGCTHHRQCEDIGTVKFPKWLSDYTGKNLHFAFTSGGDFPEALSPYALVIHCGGCMVNEQEMRSRAQRAADQGIPFTNYGTAIAEIHGILDRALAPIQ